MHKRFKLRNIIFFYWFSFPYHVRFGSDIYVWLKLKYLWVDIYA